MNRTGPGRLAIGVLVTACLPSGAAGQEPIQRRFSVRRTDQGFVLRGYRAAKGSENRFELRPGMEASEVRSQLESVAWDESSDALSQEAARAAVRRRRYGGVVESIIVELDAPDGRLRQVGYEVWPALYSREGLPRFLQAAFGPATVITDQADRLTYTYVGTDKNRGLIVDARRIAPGKSKWRLRYQLVDLTPPAVGTEQAEPKEVGWLIPIWPLPDRLDGTITTTQPARHSLELPRDLGKGLHQIYPPPETQPAETE